MSGHIFTNQKNRVIYLEWLFIERIRSRQGGVQNVRSMYHLQEECEL